VGDGFKQPPSQDVLLVKSMKLSKGIIPLAIALAAVTRVMPETRVLDVSVGAGVLKAVKRAEEAN
jgi:hypothetical protein